jgi:hypothetical protein
VQQLARAAQMGSCRAERNAVFGFDAKTPRAQAIAIAGDKIVHFRYCWRRPLRDTVPWQRS